MKKMLKILSLVLIVFATLILQSCQKEDQNSMQGTSSAEKSLPLQISGLKTFYGPTIPIGHGVARAWVQENENGEPTAVGINVSEKALENLPLEPAQFVLMFPKNKGMNFYTHMLVDWNPQGHEPAHVYDVPHFDFHFYIVPNEVRMAIGPNDNAQFDNAPAAKYIPPAYVKIPGGVPQMGAHWADVLSGEFHGSLFTKTFIWGSYDGAFIFFEPMITRAYLLTHPNEMIPIRQPAAYQRNGWYATDYKISYSTSPNEFTIALMNLTHHSAE